MKQGLYLTSIKGLGARSDQQQQVGDRSIGATKHGQSTTTYKTTQIEHKREARIEKRNPGVRLARPRRLTCSAEALNAVP